MRVLILIFILLSGVFADEKVWVPYVERDTGKIDSAVLALDGKSFYTLKDGLITRWQLNPIKRIQSFQTDIKIGRNRIGNPLYRNIFIVDDGKKIIFWTQQNIYLIDLKKETILKELTVNTIGSQLIANEFVTLTKESVMTKYDVNSLKITLSKKIPLDTSKCVPTDLTFFMMVGSKNFIYFSGSGNLARVKTKNLELLDERRGTDIRYDSVNKHLYFLSRARYGKCRDDYSECRWQINIEDGTEVKLSSIKETLVKNSLANIILEEKKLPRAPYSVRNLESKVAEGLQLLRANQQVNIYDRQSRKYIGRFYQFDNYEWIVQNRSKQYFDLSSNAKKYLYMMDKDALEYLKQSPYKHRNDTEYLKR